ncbi:mannose-6-phosphate isomerase, class I [Vibrio rumoiensis]|uniref:Mannose-6-phosphate isomerase n=1 Tax=Vibrio rumoiensis 1S-45 TaxID=1188252 RepID=A0A1E5E058_9VIBR|nr:mannose-6-phosphate isomerase, class I [Vibrio rumoiensis]OEF23270.1 mannose-6-phosphate isomerase, class I [Vibrio rumoiensis 1S-45]
MKTLPPFALMQNVIQDYAWGSTSSIESLFDIPNPEKKPQAEIWMGAHPNGCSKIEINEKSVKLDTIIEQDKTSILGERTEKRFNELPYLFKVLAAEKALSIQVHPSKEAAEIGFEKENNAGIDLKAANRNYKDPNHKPELVYALTPYQAMNGFRDYQDIIHYFEAVNAPALASYVATLKANQTEAGLSEFFQAILSLEGETKSSSLSVLMQHAEENKGNELTDLLLDLGKQYPGDVGLFAPLMLHCITLQPGEAMFLHACTPHAYIKGTGLEIMANSDNVLRAGLTPKYMDVPELIANTLCVPKPKDDILLTPTTMANVKHYPIPVDDFKFSVYQGNAEITCESAEIILAIDNDVTLHHASGQTLVLSKGQSAFIPFDAQQYQASSEGTYARAYN